MRRSVFAAAAVSFTLAGGVIPATSARADDPPTCHIEFIVPAELALSHPLRPIPFDYDASQCHFWYNYEYFVSGGAYAEQYYGSIDDQRYTAPYLIDDMRLGDWVWRGSVTDVDSADFTGTANTSIGDTRVGSAATLTVQQSGDSKVTATVTATRYWTSTHDTRSYAGARGEVQYRPAGSSGAWQILGYVNTDGTGRSAFTQDKPASGTLEYRAVLEDTPYIWGDMSTVVTGSGSARSANTHPAPVVQPPPSHDPDRCRFTPAAKGVVSSRSAELAYSYTSVGDQYPGCDDSDPVYYAYGPSGSYTLSAYVHVHDENDLGPGGAVAAQRAPTIADTMPLGLWTWKDDYGVDTSVIHTDVRVGSAAYLSATRSGHSVTLTAHAASYWTSQHKYNYRSGAVGVLQYYEPTTKTWKGLKDIVGDARGYSTWTGTVTPTRSFRVVYPDTTYTWGSTSTVVQR